jgi:hypothetical protein
MTLSTTVLLLSALQLAGSPRGRAEKAPPAKVQATPKPAVQKVLVMPVLARNGASQGTGTALGQLLHASMNEVGGYSVDGYEPTAYGMRDPVIPSLARCPDLTCAVELGRSLQFDEVIVGTLDGAEDARLSIWRVGVKEGSVLGIYEVTLDPAALDRLSRNPELVVAALMHPGNWQAPAATPAPSVVAAPRNTPVAAAPANPLPAPLPERARADVPLPVASDPVADSPLKALLRALGGVAVGAGGAALLACLGVMAGYLGVVMYDVTHVQRTGMHPFTRSFSRAVDLTAVSLGGLAVVGIPVLAVGAVMLAATWLVPSL